MSKVLVVGGTGPAGICLLRELLYRNHETVAYARNSSKIPEELLDNPKLEVGLALGFLCLHTMLTSQPPLR